MKVKAIAETAVGAALVVLFILIASYIPFFAGIGAIVCGTPLVYLCCKNGYVSGTLAALVAFLVSFALVGNIVSLGILFLSYALPALAFGIAISKNMKFLNAVLIAGLVALNGIIFEVLLVVGGADGINGMLDSYFAELQDVFNSVYSASGLYSGTDMSQAFSKAVDLTKLGVKMYLPSIFIFIAFVYAYIISIISVFVVRRLKVKNIIITPFNHLRAPSIVCTMTIILFLISIFVGGNGASAVAVKNLLLISEVIVGFCGFAFVDYKLSTVIKPVFVRILIYLGVFFFLSILVPFIAEIMVLIGFFTRMHNPID